jgi:hypothetical protein
VVRRGRRRLLQRCRSCSWPDARYSTSPWLASRERPTTSVDVSRGHVTTHRLVSASATPSAETADGTERVVGFGRARESHSPPRSPSAAAGSAASSHAQTMAGSAASGPVLGRQLDRELGDVAPCKAIVRRLRPRAAGYGRNRASGSGGGGEPCPRITTAPVVAAAGGHTRSWDLCRTAGAPVRLQAPRDGVDDAAQASAGDGRPGTRTAHGRG